MVRLSPDEEGTRRAAEIIRSGGVVIWPSGGVYGLAASALSDEGISRIYRAKGRSTDKPLQVLATAGSAARLARLPRGLQVLLEVTWPAFVGFVLPRRAPELKRVAGPGDTLLLVCPNHLAATLSEFARVPVVATSANLTHAPEILRPEEAVSTFVESVDAIIDGGTQTGELNTLVDLCSKPPVILREGAVPGRRILTILAAAKIK